MFRNTYCLFSPEGRRGHEVQGLSRTLNNSQEVIKPLLDLVSASIYMNKGATSPFIYFPCTVLESRLTTDSIYGLQISLDILR